MRLHRLIAILLLIESRGSIKARELAVSLETSLRTIHRDIDILCESGIPVKTTTGPNGGISFMDGYGVNLNNLHCDDVISLFLCGIGVRPDEDSESRMHLKQTLLKLESSLPPEYIPDIKIAKERFFFDATPWWKEKSPVTHLDTLRKSVWQTKKLEIQYKKINGEVSYRTILPYGLVVKTMNWYLIGFCEKSQEIKAFKCERITEAILTDIRFDYPKEFCVEDFWKSSTKEFKESRFENEHYPVEISLSRRYSEVLKGFDIIDQTMNDDRINATVNLHSYDFARNEVLDLIGFAEIISPPELRLYVKQTIKHLSQLYQLENELAKG